MCGIAGFVDFTKKSDLSLLKQMTDTLKLRGPDSSGYELYDSANCTIGFGHRRLSIIDLSPNGHQPMTYRDWRIIFNGEIYNYQVVRAELEALGHIFKSNSDTEVILAGFDSWGVKAIHKFIGMFSFAIINLKEDMMYVVRDRAGVKPLYYFHKHNVFAFASELKAFHPHPSFSKKIDTSAIRLFFSYGYIPAPYSIFSDVFKLFPGHYIAFNLKNNQSTTIKYWDVNHFYEKPKLKIDEKESLLELEKLLQSASEYRMIADVPVGVFLSGGYDSSTMAGILQKERTKKLKTFTIGFQESQFNEAPFAKEIAEYIGTDHTEYYCSPQDALDILPSIPHIFDEPFGDNSIIPTILVSKLARKEVTVALSADGGDETFVGYYKYDSIIQFRNRVMSLPKAVRQALAYTLSHIDAGSIPVLKNKYNFAMRYEKVLSLLTTEDISSCYKALNQFFSNRECERLIKVKDSSPLQTTLLDIVPDTDYFLDQVLAIDYKTYMVDDILTKVDKATMSVSLEGREPFLDHRIIEFAAQLPIDLKYKNNNKKYLLKKIAHKYVPESLLNRPKKGFIMPITEWFYKDLKPLLEYYLSQDKLEKQGILDATYVNKLLKRFYAGQTGHIYQLWLVLMFQMWYEEWIEGTKIHNNFN